MSVSIGSTISPLRSQRSTRRIGVTLGVAIALYGFALALRRRHGGVLGGHHLGDVPVAGLLLGLPRLEDFLLRHDRGGTVQPAGVRLAAAQLREGDERGGDAPGRAERRLDRAQRILSELQVEIEDFYRRGTMSDELLGLRNGIQTALAIHRAASDNRVSKGTHYRENGSADAPPPSRKRATLL